jgi:hypothetical protein
MRTLPCARVRPAAAPCRRAGQYLVRGEVELCEGAYGGADLAHARGGLDTRRRYVADGEGHASAGERDHVEPAAAHPGVRAGRAVVVRDLDGALVRNAAREHALLESHGGGALARVATGIVHADSGAGDELLHEDQVVGFEGVRVGRRAVQTDHPQDGVSGAQGHHQQGVGPPRQQRPCPGVGRVPDPGGVGIDARQQPGFPVGEGLGVG